MIDDLPHLTDITMLSSRGYIEGDLYKEAYVEFCDGYEIFIDEHKKEEVTKNISVLKNLIQNEFVMSTVKNISAVQRGNLIYLWITMAPDSAYLTDYTLPQIKKTIKAVKDHAKLTWNFNAKQIDSIMLSKIDIA